MAIYVPSSGELAGYGELKRLPECLNSVRNTPGLPERLKSGLELLFAKLPEQTR